MKPVASRKIRFKDIEQKPYESPIGTTNFNFNIFILYDKH